MNDAQRAAIRQRQRAQVGTEPAERAPPPTPAPPQRPLNELAAELRPDVGPGIEVAFLRFLDKSFQVAGMQSGETLTAIRHPNGREHRIELVTVAGAGCFLITHLDPARRAVDFDLVERSSVKSWRLAAKQ